MTSRQAVSTNKAPDAIGVYSQAVAAGNTLYISGQIPLDPNSMEVVEGDMETLIRRVFDNLSAIAEAAGASLADVVKLTVFLTDMVHFPTVNQVMAEYFDEPYPARAVVGVAALPKNVPIEIEAILYLPA